MATSWQCGASSIAGLLICLGSLGLPRPADSLDLAPPALTEPRFFDASSEAQLTALINQARRQKGLAPLAVDSRLTDAAREHSALMAQRSSLSHQFAGEPPLQDRFAAQNIASDREGENVALDQNAVSAHDGLMHSPPHRRNILDPEYDAVGVGVIRRGPNIYVTEDFARLLPQLSEPQAEAAVESAVDHNLKSRGFPAPPRRPQPQLRRIACDMARKDAVNGGPASQLPGVRTVFAWTAGNPAALPKAMDRVLSSGVPGGYSLGACFAPSVSHPGGLYWIVMVSY